LSLSSNYNERNNTSAVINQKKPPIFLFFYNKLLELIL